MELLLIPAFLVFAMICIGMQNHTKNKPKKAIPSPEPTKTKIRAIAEKNQAEAEEPIEKVVQRTKNRKRQDREHAYEVWDNMFYSYLPVIERPDYFEPKRSDSRNCFVSKSANGTIVAEHSWFTNSRGKSYTIHPDHMSKVIGISCSGMYWNVPMEEYKFLLDK